MENLFNFDRFRLLVRKHANENWKIFLISLLIMILPVLWAQIFRFLDPLNVFNIYMSFLWIIGGLYSSTFFKEWNYKARSESIILLPSTAFEKIALVFFHTIIIFIPVYSFLFYSSWIVLSKLLHPGGPFSYILEYQNLPLFRALIVYVFTPYLFMQSFLLLFSIWFNKRQTVIAFAVFAFAFASSINLCEHYIQYLSGNHSVNVNNYLLFFPIDIWYYGEGVNLKTTSQLNLNLGILVLWLVTLLFYMASYFKLKEKEI